ncbi:MAG: hypothetical protein NW207_05090 [Cytophagales bacterium]|nr:hypothetical protein [Cytophagales bacterium]
MDDNFGIPQISKYITNLGLFDGKPELIEKYAAKVKSGKYDNIPGYDAAKYATQMARIAKI